MFRNINSHSGASATILEWLNIKKNLRRPWSPWLKSCSRDPNLAKKGDLMKLWEASSPSFYATTTPGPQEKRPQNSNETHKRKVKSKKHLLVKDFGIWLGDIPFLCLPMSLCYYVSSARKTHIKVPVFEVVDAAQALATTFACWFSTTKIWCHSVSVQLLTSPHLGNRKQNSGVFGVSIATAMGPANRHLRTSMAAHSATVPLHRKLMV